MPTLSHSRSADVHRNLRRFLRRQRRWVAAALASLAVLCALSALTPGDPPVSSLLVAAADMPTGHVLTANDLTYATWSAESAVQLPLTDQASVLGRPLAAPIERGEPLTSTRVVGPNYLDQLQGTQQAELVGAPVRLADAHQAQLIRPGDRIDVLAASDTRESSIARTVATDALVLSVPGTADTTGEGFLNKVGPSNDGSVVTILGVTADTALELAAAATRGSLSIVIKSTDRQ